MAAGRKPARVEVYRDRTHKYRWRAIARNGEEVARSEQGYVRRGYCRGRAEVLNPGVPVVLV
jgi:uncharacterized protein YegP (UPF0339 family)